jgi:hypothetical protein
MHTDRLFYAGSITFKPTRRWRWVRRARKVTIMTWGSNPTYRLVPCRYCFGPCIDDRADGGLTSHERTCPRRPWYVRLVHRCRRG